MPAENEKIKYEEFEGKWEELKYFISGLSNMYGQGRETDILHEVQDKMQELETQT